MGTIYGGSLYGSTDPMYMLMLMQILGKDFVVWDKGCNFRFKRPADRTIFADFRITPEMLSTLRSEVEQNHETTFTWPISYQDKDGAVYAEFDKMLYVAKKNFYLEKLKKRKQQALAQADEGQ
jgi:hypothetical protein